MLKKILLTFLISLNLCTIAQAQNVTIFSTNDLHGRLLPFDYQDKKNVGGAARRATILNSEPNALVLDAGDYAQGTLYFKILKENLNLIIMEALGYDAITLGNHEFDKGIPYLKKSALSTKIPFLASNVKFYDEELDNLVQDFVIKEINGIKIAIIGVLDSALKATSSTNPNLYEVFDEVKSVQKAVKKADKKSDLIIVLSHCGIEKDKIIAQKVKGIDLIIGGHSHTMLKKPLKIRQSNGDNVLISQNGEFGTVVGRWDLTVEKDKISQAKFSYIPVNSQLRSDEKITNFLKSYDKKINDFSATVAGYSITPIDARRNSVRTHLTTAGALLHKAIKHYYPDVEVSFNTSGGYRYGDFLPQVITNKDVEELFPFESYLVLFEMKGSDIKELLETSSRFLPKASGSFLQTSGLSYTVNIDGKSKKLNQKLDTIIQNGTKVSEIKVNGEPLDSEKYYKVATDTFMYYGGDGYIELKKYKNVKHTYFFLDKILIRYLQENSPVEIKSTDKIILKKKKR